MLPTTLLRGDSENFGRFLLIHTTTSVFAAYMSLFLFYLAAFDEPSGDIVGAVEFVRAVDNVSMCHTNIYAC